MEVLIFLVALLALLGVIVLFIFYFTERNRFLHADRYTVVQAGTNTGAFTVIDAGNTVLIVTGTNPSTGPGLPTTVTIQTSDHNEEGTTLYVVNPAPPATTPPTVGNNVTVVAGTGITLTDVTGKGQIVAPGTTALYVFTDHNVATRIQ